jgi:hypothetical protein
MLMRYPDVPILPNIHHESHLTESILRQGVPREYACFAFESTFKSVKSYVRNHNNGVNVTKALRISDLTLLSARLALKRCTLKANVFTYKVGEIVVRQFANHRTFYQITEINEDNLSARRMTQAIDLPDEIKLRHFTCLNIVPDLSVVVISSSVVAYKCFTDKILASDTFLSVVQTTK